MNKKVEELERKLSFYKNIVICLVLVCVCLVSIIFQPYITNCLNFIITSYNSLTDYQKGQIEGFTVMLMIFLLFEMVKFTLNVDWWYKYG